MPDCRSVQLRGITPGDCSLAKSRGAGLEVGPLGRTGDHRYSDLSNHIVLPQTECEGSEVGDLQGHVPAPSGMDRRCRQMDNQAGTSPRALAVDESDEARIIARRADQFLRLPEEKAACLDEDTIAIPIDLLIRIARLPRGWRNQESRKATILIFQ
jgi:hypothetical protein